MAEVGRAVTTGRPDDRGPAARLVAPVGLALACLVALTLHVLAIHAHSLSGDGAYHLLAGHQALRYGRNTINLEHPPLVKVLIAAPQLFEETPLAPSVRVEHALATTDAMHRTPELLWRATVGGRYVALALFGLPFLISCWFLGRRLGDRRVAWILVLMLALSFSVFPSFVILQTDTAVALAFVLTVLAGIGFIRRPGLGNAALLGAALGLGLATKFSGLLLVPTALASVALAPDLRSRWRRRLGETLLLGVTAWLVVDATYLIANLDYERSVGREVIETYVDGRGTLVVGDHLRRHERLLLAVERVDPFLAQWLTGLLGHQAQNRVAPYPSYAFGEVYSEGRWWYLPAMLAIKTPLAVLGVAALAVARWRPRIPLARVWAIPALTAVVYLATYLVTNYNLGVRHLLPVLPILLLPVAMALAARPRIAVLLVAALAVESAVVSPHWASTTNTWWLGRHNPTRLALGTGNTEYRLNFVQLARLAERRGIRDLGVLYPFAPEVVIRAYLPSARVLSAGDEPGPGWYAVNVSMEQYLPALLRAEEGTVYAQQPLTRLARRWQPTWQAVMRGEDHGYVAGSFHLYRLPDEAEAARP